MIGIHTDMPAAKYHADPAAPSLSASIAATLVNRSPLHAWASHPRLNPACEPVEKTIFDTGTVAHAILLEGDDSRCQVIEALDWRKKETKEARDEARANGLIPLLTHQFAEVQAMVSAARSQLDALDLDPRPFTAGAPEQTLVWGEQGVTCRARLDWLSDDRLVIDDLKTTGGSAHPTDWARRQLFERADIQVAMYRRGVKALTGIEPAMRFVVIETEPPYGLSIVGLTAQALEVANAKLDYALATWRRCLETGKWPGYSADATFVDAPAWVEASAVELVAAA